MQLMKVMSTPKNLLKYVKFSGNTSLWDTSLLTPSEQQGHVNVYGIYFEVNDTKSHQHGPAFYKLYPNYIAWLCCHMFQMWSSQCFCGVFHHTSLMLARWVSHFEVLWSTPPPPLPFRTSTRCIPWCYNRDSQLITGLRRLKGGIFILRDCRISNHEQERKKEVFTASSCELTIYLCLPTLKWIVWKYSQRHALWSAAAIVYLKDRCRKHPHSGLIQCMWKHCRTH